MAPKASTVPALGTPVGGAPTSAGVTGTESSEDRAKREVTDVWTRWFEGALKEGQVMDVAIMRDAAVKAFEAGILSVQDSGWASCCRIPYGSIC